MYIRQVSIGTPIKKRLIRRLRNRAPVYSNASLDRIRTIKQRMTTNIAPQILQMDYGLHWDSIYQSLINLKQTTRIDNLYLVFWITEFVFDVQIPWLILGDLVRLRQFARKLKPLQNRYMKLSGTAIALQNSLPISWKFNLIKLANYE